MTTWLITGCSTGLGRALALAALKNGDNVVVTARDTSTVADIVAAYPSTAVAAGLDVTDPVEVDNAVALAQTHFGAIDVLVNNAGYGYRSAVEEGDAAEVAALFDTNFFGTVSMIKAVLPGMRARRSGVIFNVSSIAARRAMPGSAYYSATKFAMEGMSDALKREVEPLGIRVMVVEPGPFRTDFAGRSLKGATQAIADYEGTVGPRRKVNDKTSGTQKGDPERAACVLVDILKRPKLPLRLLLGSEAVSMVRDELATQIKELEDWAELGNSTDFPQVS